MRNRISDLCHPIRDMANTPSLFDPILIGDLHLPNRIFMAPLTRLRGTADHIPTPIIAEYYRQRSTAGLILSEGIPIDPLGVGYAKVPGLWSREQTEAWKPVTSAVHDAGGAHLRADLARRTYIGPRIPQRPASRCSERHRGFWHGESFATATPLRHSEST
jgi:hypothetical protein